MLSHAPSLDPDQIEYGKELPGNTMRLFRSRRSLVIASVVAAIPAIFLLAFFVLGTLFVRGSLERIRKHEAYLRRPEVYTPVAQTLARYCQSDPKYFHCGFNVAWMPDVLASSPRCYGGVASEQADVEFGGGFYHYGYLLKRDAEKSRPGVNVWQMHLLREESPDELLSTFSLPASEKVSVDQIVEKVVRYGDSQIAQATDEYKRESAYQSKIVWLLHFDRIADAQAVCRQMLVKMPDNWWAQLANAMLLSKAQTPAAGEKALREWIKQRPEFCRWLDMAYYFKRQGQSHKMAEAIQEAVRCDVDEEHAHGGNAVYRGYAAAVDALNQGECDAAILLCDKLLTAASSDDYGKPELTALREAAQKGCRNPSACDPYDSELPPFRPFEMVDEAKLFKVTDYAKHWALIATVPGDLADSKYTYIGNELKAAGISYYIHGSLVYDVQVPPIDRDRAIDVLKRCAARKGIPVQIKN
jgi:hypothetical protein